VFLRLAEETRLDLPVDTPANETVELSPPLKGAERDSVSADSSKKDDLGLLTGVGTSILRQAWILFCKRVIVLRRNWVPYVCAVIIPIAAAGLVTFFFKNFRALSCSPSAQVSTPKIAQVDLQTDLKIPIGPPDRVPQEILALLTGGNTTAYHMVNTLEEFNSYIQKEYQSVLPGGVYLGDTPTMAYIGNYILQWSVLTQTIMSSLLANQLISTQFQQFAVPFAPSAGKSLQAIFYFGLAMCAYPGFFTLYPTVERLRKVRALHNSNAIRAGPLWLAYTAFDFLFVLLVSVVAIVIWISITDIWYYPGMLFVVFFLYGLTSILFSYVISLFVSSQLAAFAWVVGVQAVFFLLYFVTYLSILTYSPAYRVDYDIVVAHFTLALITPAGNLLRALLLTLNEFSILCHGTDQIAPYSGDITAYGGPVLYLIAQAIVLFIFLVWWDSGYKLKILRRAPKAKKDNEEISTAVGPKSKCTSSFKHSFVLSRFTRSLDAWTLRDITHLVL